MSPRSLSSFAFVGRTCHILSTYGGHFSRVARDQFLYFALEHEIDDYIIPLLAILATQDLIRPYTQASSAD